MSGDDIDGHDDPAPPEDATVSVRPIIAAPSSLVGRVIDAKYVVREVPGKGDIRVVVRAHHLALDAATISSRLSPLV